MNEKELLNESIEIFDTQEKWEALFEIHSKSGQIMDYWMERGGRALRDEYLRSPDPDWEVQEWGVSRDSRWFLKSLGHDSLGLGFGWPEWEFHLHFAPSHAGSLEKATQYLGEPHFRALRAMFPATPDRGRLQEGAIACDVTFNPFGGSTEPVKRRRELAWKASHETPEFVSAMLFHVRQILCNPVLTQLFRELNDRLSSDEPNAS